MCGGDADVEAQRFANVRDSLGAFGTFGTITMPVPYELVLTLARGVPRGFAYLTQGAPQATFHASATSLLTNVLKQLLAQNALADAELVADLFRTAFPAIDASEHFSPLTQGMLVGFVPRPEHFDLKLYFNTRVDVSVPHRSKVLTMVERCGGDASLTGTLYDALYSAQADTTFSGVGVDVSDATGRAKLYVHGPRTRTRELIASIAPELALGSVDTLLDATDSDAASTDCEIAFAVRGSGTPPTLKLTVFYAGKLVTEADQERALALLERWGYASDGVRSAIASLQVDDAQAQVQPLHGIGIELTGDASPKVNVYLKPAI